MVLRRISIGLVSAAALLLVSAWKMPAHSDDDVSSNKDESRATKAADEGEADVAGRFDYLVREDLFAGFAGDEEAMQRGLKTVEDALAENPRHAEALVWRGAARVVMSGQAFEKGDQATGFKYWTTGIKDMDAAIEIEPDNLGVLIPRAAVLLPAGRSAPPAMGKPVLMKVRGDLERTYERQKDYFDELGEHPQGELRMALADVYRLLEQPEKSKAQLEAVVKELPETAYAERATQWLAAPQEQNLAHNCIGCHTE